MLSSTVIVCTRNRPDDIVTFLHSLERQIYRDFELIVVDSSDTPLSKDPFFNDMVNAFKHDYTYIRSNPGLTLQRNKGIKLAKGEVVYFFDDDVVLESNYLEVMQQTFAENGDYLGGMGSVTNMQQKESKKWRMLSRFFLLHRDYAHGYFTLSGMPTHAYGTTQFKEVQVLGGCCMAFKKDVLKKHQFDETLTRYAYMEDCDISCRVAQDGPLFYQPKARLEHNNSPLARDAVIDNRAMFVRNYRYLYFKNIYQQNKLSIIAHWWSLLGLFVYALCARDKDAIKGYVRALWLQE